MRAVRVSLNKEDLWFIRESIGQNVPSESDRTAAETATVDKLEAAIARLNDKEQKDGS